MMPGMKKAGKGTDAVRTLSLSLALADHVEPEERERCRKLCLRNLVKAVKRDAETRGFCRDTDVSAATRVRPWLVA